MQTAHYGKNNDIVTFWWIKYNGLTNTFTINLVLDFFVCSGPFPIFGWARAQPTRKEVAYVMASLIG